MNQIDNTAEQEATIELIRKGLKKAISYKEYRVLVAKLVQEGLSTGPQQSEALANYTMLNDRRMKRWDKTLKFTDEVIETINAYDKKTTWLVLTESWCGDASSALPVMNKIAELNPNINFKIILRDEHTELMNQFLTNGGMSIPKLIAIDAQTSDVLGDWGPRSKAATKLVDDHKEKYGEIKPEFKEELQQWYNKDKGQSIVSNLTSLLLKNISDGSLL